MKWSDVPAPLAQSQSVSQFSRTMMEAHLSNLLECHVLGCSCFQFGTTCNMILHKCNGTLIKERERTLQRGRGGERKQAITPFLSSKPATLSLSLYLLPLSQHEAMKSKKRQHCRCKNSHFCYFVEAKRDERGDSQSSRRQVCRNTSSKTNAAASVDGPALGSSGLANSLVMAKEGKKPWNWLLGWQTGTSWNAHTRLLTLKMDHPWNKIWFSLCVCVCVCCEVNNSSTSMICISTVAGLPRLGASQLRVEEEKKKGGKSTHSLPASPLDLIL